MTDREIKRTVFNLQHASFGKAVAIIHSIYAQGYADGHSACCEELSVEDGDEVITMSIFIHRNHRLRLKTSAQT